MLETMTSNPKIWQALACCGWPYLPLIKHLGNPPSHLPLKSQQKLYLQLPSHHNLSAVIPQQQCHYIYNRNIL